MTDEEFKIVKLICKVHDFTIHPPEEYSDYRIVSCNADKNKGHLYWREDEGLEAFIFEVGRYFREVGYETATRW